ncbi:MAG: hypothetical protein J7513_10950 [Solirubrobacteraceae bacterium]|nr:hypothetical protein [Solirubrobacteraceae bacterium]
MEGAGWSEVVVQLDRVYASERGAPKPEGRHAAELVARDFVQRAAAEDISGVRAIALAEELWIALGHPEGDIADLGLFDDHLALVRQGVAGGTPASVVAEFVAVCRRIVAAGGPILGSDSDLSPRT